MKYIDEFLNTITMYKLVTYGTFVLALFAIGFAALGIISMSAGGMIISLVILFLVCAGTNHLFGYLFSIPVNVESSYITALILFLIFPAPETVVAGLVIAAAGAIAMASKYIVNYRGKHLFNPAAFGTLVIVLSGIGVATWWVGSTAMFVPALIVGFLVVRKIRRFPMVLTFLILAVASIVMSGIYFGATFSQALLDSFLSWPLIFFGTIMLTEPLTAPPTRKLRIVYAAIVGVLFGTTFHIGPVYASPETALIIGNIFSFAVSAKERWTLRLLKRVELAPMLYDFIFQTNRPMAFEAGQYTEWTLGHRKPDSRGNRRYFTIASSPREREIHLGIKVPDNASSFKKALLDLQPGSELLVNEPIGDFTLPGDIANLKVLAIAGGIGITPFRSMVQNLIDTNQKSDLILLYAAPDPSQFVYSDIFIKGEKVGIQYIPFLSGAKVIPEDWHGHSGFITAEVIKEIAPDYKDRIYYLSGPNAMVQAYKKTLRAMGILRTNIITDYFPGY